MELLLVWRVFWCRCLEVSLVIVRGREMVEREYGEVTSEEISVVNLSVSY